MRHRLPAVLLVALAPAWGGRSAGAATGAGAAPGTVTVVVFYDENGNGRIDPGEEGRVPGVRVGVGGRSGWSEPGTGRAVLREVPAGRHRLSVFPDTLPPFYRVGRPVAVTLPPGGNAAVAVPLLLPIGANRPGTYLAFGDSITDGDRSSDGAGYRGRLEARLRAHFGTGRVINGGASATTSHQGAHRIAAWLVREHPAYALILYGTNDWGEGGGDAEVTVRSLRRIVEAVQAARSLPVLATIPPTHVGADRRASAARNRQVAEIDRRLRALARSEGALLADVHAAFEGAGDLPGLFSDGLHPDDAGYDLIARTFFEAIAGTGNVHDRQPPSAEGTPRQSR